MLDLWATWCGRPCIEDMPYLEQLEDEHAKDGVQVVALSIRPMAGAPSVARILRVHPDLEFTVGLEQDASVDQAYMAPTKSVGVPTRALIDRQGRLGWVGAPGPEFDAAFEVMVSGEHDLDEARRLRASLQGCL